MNKKITVFTILGLSIFMVVSWAVIFFTNTREQQINYWWQVGLAVCPILFGLFGLITAKKWSWLKSGVGRSVFFISLGLIVWGIGQAGWTYFLFKYPGEESPPSHLLDIIDFATIPVWIYGIFKLSRATGAKFGFKKLRGKILVVVLPLLMSAISYYFLVTVARGGSAYFDQPFWKAFFDLGYSIGDGVILTIALVIFGLSWKLLGGRFRKPTLLIIIGFGLLYLADFAFSYTDGKGEYYNGNVADLLFILMIATLGVALNLFSPSRLKQVNTADSMTDPAQTQSAPVVQNTSSAETPAANTPVVQAVAEPITTPISSQIPITTTVSTPEEPISNPIVNQSPPAGASTSTPAEPVMVVSTTANLSQPVVGSDNLIVVEPTLEIPDTDSASQGLIHLAAALDINAEPAQAPVPNQIINPTGGSPINDSNNQEGLR